MSIEQNTGRNLLDVLNYKQIRHLTVLDVITELLNLSSIKDGNNDSDGSFAVGDAIDTVTQLIGCLSWVRGDFTCVPPKFVIEEGLFKQIPSENEGQQSVYVAAIAPFRWRLEKLFAQKFKESFRLGVESH